MAVLHISVATLAATMLLLAAGQWRRSQAAPFKGRVRATVTVVKPERNTVRGTVQLPGQVEPAEQTKLYAQVAGSVQKIHVDIGDRVRRGQVLADLAVPELNAELVKKKAAVALAEAKVDRARQAVVTAEAALAVAKARVEEEEAGVRLGQANLILRLAQQKRLQALAVKKVVDKSAVEEANSQLEIAKSSLSQAEARLKSAKKNQEESTARRNEARADVKVAQAAVAVARAGVEPALVRLRFARVEAPFDGVITRRFADVGALAGPPQGRQAALLFVVVRTDPVRIAIEVPEHLLPLISRGVRATVRPGALKGQEFRGTVSRLAGAIDPKTLLLRAEIDLPNPAGKLVPGMSADVVLTAQRADVWTLPVAAVVKKGGQTFCYRVEDGKAVRTPVQVGLEGNRVVEVLGKLLKPAAKGGAWEQWTGDEEVIVTDPAALKDGQAVRVGREKK
jgi:RND family efflux transporter MFP subunit